MMSTGQLTYDLSAMISDTFLRLAMTSMYLPASRMAAVIARAVFGFFCTNSAVVPSVFSG